MRNGADGWCPGAPWNAGQSMQLRRTLIRSVARGVLPGPGPMIPPRHPSNLHPAGLLNQRPILPSAGIKDDTVAAGGETPAEIEPDLLRRSAPRRRHGKKKPKGDRDIHQAGGTAAATACSKPA